MRASHCIRPTNRCKGPSGSTAEISPTVPTTGQPVPLTPDDRARKVAELRRLLGDAASTFRARLEAAGRGELP